MSGHNPTRGIRAALLTTGYRPPSFCWPPRILFLRVVVPFSCHPDPSALQGQTSRLVAFGGDRRLIDANPSLPGPQPPSEGSSPTRNVPAQDVCSFHIFAIGECQHVELISPVRLLGVVYPSVALGAVYAPRTRAFSARNRSMVHALSRPWMETWSLALAVCSIATLKRDIARTGRNSAANQALASRRTKVSLTTTLRGHHSRSRYLP